jgi:hypothetical protein
MGDLWDWLMVNPARLMVVISLIVTWCTASIEYSGRNLGGSGWVTLARIGFGGIFALVTAIVAAFFGGVGAFFGYLLIQIIVCIVIPLVWVEKM